MKKKALLLRAALFSSALLGLMPSMALAGGVNFAWRDCLGNSNATAARTYSCGQTSEKLVAAGSFKLSSPMPDFVAVEVIVDVQAQGASLPSWWEYGNPGCRNGALAMTFDFSAFANPEGVCADPFGAVAQGGMASYTTSGNHARVIGIGAVATEGAQSLRANTEYYAFRLSWSTAKTTGPGSCAGCATPVSLVLSGIRVLGLSPTSVEELTSAIANQCIAWQGATASLCEGGPQQNRTWGQLKSLYRR